MSKKLRIGIPIGSLEKSTLQIMEKAGFETYFDERSYSLNIDDEELEGKRYRPQDMSRFVEKGIIDSGITGKDWIEENRSDVIVVTDLIYAKQRFRPVRWVLAVPENSKIESVKDLQGKRVSTELVNVTKRFLAEKGVNADVEFSHGATEAKAPDLVDAIVDVTETGSSLRANNLRIVDTVMESVTQFIANKDSWEDEWKRRKIQDVVVLIEGAIAAHDKVGLKMNVPAESLDAVLAILPAMKRPTVSSLAEAGWHAVETIIEERTVRRIIPKLKRAGAEGIVEFSLNKVIP